MLVYHHITCEKFSILFMWIHHFNMNNEAVSHQWGDFFCYFREWSKLLQWLNLHNCGDLWKATFPCKITYSEQSVSEDTLKQPHNWSHSSVVHRFWLMMSLTQQRKCKEGSLKSACWWASHIQRRPETSCGMAIALQSTLEVVWLGLLFSSLWKGE